MLMVAHTMVGIAVASLVDQPAIALPLAFLSHFVMDMVPHWDPLIGDLKSDEFTGVGNEARAIIATDFLIALDLGLLFIWHAISGGSVPDVRLAATIFFAAFLANLPDGMMTPFIFFGKRWGWLMAYIRLHSRVQTKLRLPWGIITQVLAVAASVFIALK